MKKTTLLALSVLAVSSLFAQSAVEQDQTIVTYPTSFAISPTVAELSEKYQSSGDALKPVTKEHDDHKNRTPIIFQHTGEDGLEWDNDPSTLQTTMGTRTPATINAEWEGQGMGSGGPPDPSGAAGPNHYVQAINATPVKIFNKTSGAQVALFQMGSLWSPATQNYGDPVVLYDKTADRWFLSQFNPASPDKVYLAVSQTNNPAGAYYTYTFSTGTGSGQPSFPDFLKFSIWHDGYYMTANWTSGGQQQVWVFERTAMIAGNASARMAKKTYTATGSPTSLGFVCSLTGDADGQLPTSGPCPLVYAVDNGWGASADGIYLKEVTTVWGTTPSVTVSTGSIIPTNAHDMSYANNFQDIPQPGTTQRLDGVGGILQFRAQWRKWPSYNTLVLSFPVRVSTTQRSFKWVELRQTGTTWSKYQEGVYTPDTKYRWIPSIAMNDNGDIAVTYARSSTTTGDFPSACFTGRCKNDALGQLTVPEVVVEAGTSSQSGFNYSWRFGDYGQTGIDPSSGTTFWATQNYTKSNSGKTRIWSFQLGCPTGIGENGEDIAAYNVYQNGNVINVEGSNLASNENTQVDLFDINGKEVSNQVVKPISNSIKTTINVTGLSSGVYLVRIGNDSYQKVIKILIK